MSNPNWFGELIAILHTEELLRLRRRLELKGNPVLAEVLNDEIIERDAIERAAYGNQK